MTAVAGQDSEYKTHAAAFILPPDTMVPDKHEIML
jgi:hypothetical protein